MRRISRLSVLLLTALMALVPGLLGTTGAVAAPGGAATPAPTTTQALQRGATVNLTQLAAADAGNSSATPPAKGGHGHNAPLGVPPTHGQANGPQPKASTLSPFTGNIGGESGFDGITAAINGAANSPDIGGVGDVSPPDQGLAVGPGPSGTVLAEFVNDTLNFYNPSGQTLLGALPAFQVFGLPPNAFLSDPRAYWDPPTGHWFLTMFTVGDGGTPSNGECANGAAPPNCLSAQYIAVSATTNPFGAYAVFAIDTSDTSNTANGCPCFGDFDQVGADASGFYIATNEFPLNTGGPGFNGSVIYAMSKSGLIAYANGGAAPAVQRYVVPFAGPGADPFAGYHVSPSTVTQGSDNPSTEYFVESNANLPNDATANGLEVFALLNTSVLASGGRPSLVMTTVNTESYSELPPNATQKTGPTPLGCSVGSCGVATLQTDFNAVQEVTYAGGRLYAELSTGFALGTQMNAGAAWFVLQPTPSATGLTVANLANGYVETTQNILYPVIAVNASGKGYMAFAVSGPDMYPSAAYMTFDGTKGATGKVRIAASGTAPLDDFTCYPSFFGESSCRYGDYSMAQEYNGVIYMATEYVGSQPRDTLSNWGTRVYWVPDK